MHLPPTPTTPGPLDIGQHVPRHSAGTPGHIHPNKYIQRRRHHPAVESFALGPPSLNHHHQHISGDKRSQATDGEKRAHQRATAHITVHPAAHLLEDFGTQQQIALEEQGHHIIIAALYTLAAKGCHWDHITIPAMAPTPQSVEDLATPLHINQILLRTTSPHLLPSRMAFAIASWHIPQATDHLHPKGRRRTVGATLGTGSPHGGPGLQPELRP